jgi:hypothetical protein
MPVEGVIQAIFPDSGFRRKDVEDFDPFIKLNDFDA